MAPPWTLPLISPPSWLGAGAATVVPFTPGPGVQLSGSAADQATFCDMVGREMARSQTFRDLMNVINSDAAHPLRVDVGRDQPRIFVDAFNGGGHQTLDLADIEQWPVDPPPGHPDAMTQGQNLVHSLAEARQGALGNTYGPSHAAAIDAENAYRRDNGQTSSLQSPPNDASQGAGGSVIFQFDNGYREEAHVGAGGSTMTGITRHNPPAGTS